MTHRAPHPTRSHLPLALVGVGAALCLAPLASAQVAPPPPPPPTPEPEYVPPPRPQARPAPSRPDSTSRTSVERGAVRMGTNEAAPDSGAGAIPGLKYNKMAVEDEDGLIRRVDIPLHYQALQNNPTVGITVAEQLPAHLVARRARFEELLIEHYEDFDLIESGLLEDLSIFDTEALTAAAEAMKNLVGPTTLTQELESKKVLTPMQARFNAHIVREYEQAVRAEIERVAGENALSEQVRFMFDTALQEIRDARDGMVLEALLRPEEVFDWADANSDGLGFSATERAAFEAMRISDIAAIDPDGTVAGALAEVHAWDPEHQRAFYRAVAYSREDRFAIPMLMIDVTEGKSIEFQAPPEVSRPGQNQRPNQGQNQDAGNGGG